MRAEIGARLASRAARLACGAAVMGLAALLITGCGSKAAASGGAASDSGFTAYRTCLSQHGVSLPTSRPSGAPGSGGFGGFGGGGDSSTFEKAAKSCASLRPSFGGGRNGGGFAGGGFGTALQAFRTCMSDHGEPIPTARPTSPEAGSSPQDRFLNGLNPGNSKVAAALKACESKLPSFAQ